MGFPFFKRNKLYARLREFEHENKVFYAFRSKSEVDRFLRGLGQTQGEHVLENTYALE